MIKDVKNANEGVSANQNEIKILREHFPACFKIDGSFDLERFKEYLSDKVYAANDGYELRFLGKNYARLLASLETTTVIVPNEEHNRKPENASSENIYISGDNLDGLKHLLKSYNNKIKCIYIDPPYNTGKDDFAYNDKFSFTINELVEKLSITETHAQRILDLTTSGRASHSAWLTFVYPRLLMARDLLTNDGVIFVSIDDNEQSNLKLILDDIFGEECFVGTIIWKNATDNNPTNIATEHEYIICYCKKKDALASEWKSDSSDMKEKMLEIETDILKKYKKDLPSIQKAYTAWYNEHKSQLGKLEGYKFCDADGIYAGSRSVHNPGKKGYYYDVFHPITGKPCKSPLMGYRFPEDSMKELISNNRIIYGEDENKIIELKEYLNSYTDKLSSVIDIDGRSGANIMRSLFDKKNVFKNPKTPLILEEILPFVLNDHDIVLDFFAGSSTTAHAIMEMNSIRKQQVKYILIQLDELSKENEAQAFGFSTIDQIGVNRIVRAAKKIREENPSIAADLGFRHFTLKEPTKDAVDKLENFKPETGFLITNNILQDFGVPTVLATWLVRDGYGFTAPVKTIAFADYTAFYMDKHLYLINPKLSNEAVASITEKYETDGSFNPENVILFGYSFTWTEIESLKANLSRFKDTERNLRINFDIRY